MLPHWKHFQSLRASKELRQSRGLDYDIHIRKHILAYLDSLKPKELANGNDPKVSDPLAVLDPALDTLPYIFVLTAQIEIASGRSRKLPDTLNPDGPLWDKLASFLANFDTVEVRYAGQKFARLLKFISDIAGSEASQGRASRPMALMAEAILRLDPTAGTFTTSHLRFIRACAEFYPDDALVLLEKDIHSFPAKEPSKNTYLCSNHASSSAYITVATGFTDTISFYDVHEYYILGAHVYMMLGMWSGALYYLEHVLSTPSNQVVCGTMLEAYKKWVLLQLLLKGKIGPFPKTLSQGSVKILRNAAKPYESFAAAFSLPDSSKLRAEAHEAHNFFDEDNNVFLVQRVIEQHEKNAVLEFQKLYAAVPFSLVAERLKLLVGQTDLYVTKLIHEGTLQAVVQTQRDPDNPVLRFSTEESKQSTVEAEEQMQRQLVERTGKIRALIEDAAEAEQRLRLTREWMRHELLGTSAKEGAEGTRDDQMDIFPGQQNMWSEDEDEDNIMSEL